MLHKLSQMDQCMRCLYWKAAPKCTTWYLNCNQKPLHRMNTGVYSVCGDLGAAKAQMRSACNGTSFRGFADNCKRPEVKRKV